MRSLRLDVPPPWNRHVPLTLAPGRPLPDVAVLVVHDLQLALIADLTANLRALPAVSLSADLVHRRFRRSRWQLGKSSATPRH
jgi:hypothetical protein